MKGKPTGHRAARGDEPKRSFFNARLGATLKARLEEAASAGARSLSEEIERRLERSLEDPLGDPRSAEVFKSLGDIARQVAVIRRQHWLDDYAGFQAIIERWNQHLETLRPDPSKDLIDHANFALSKIAAAHDLGDRQGTIDAGFWLTRSGLPAPMLRTALERASAFTGIPAEEFVNAEPHLASGEWAIGYMPAPGDSKRHMRFYGPPEDAPPGAEVMPYVPAPRDDDDGK